MVERLAALGPAGRDGPDVPRPRAEPAPPLLAAPARGRSRCPTCSTRSCRCSCRSPAACPATTGSRRPRTSPTRSSGPRAGASRRRPTAAAVAGSPTAPSREPPIPLDLFVGVFADYERAKARAGRIDFDDLLVGTVDLLETRPGGRRDRPRPEALVQRRRVPGHEPAAAAAAGAVVGDRDDLCVVGDADQTIYTFTGATSEFLTGFARRHPGRTGRRRSPRTTDRRPQVLALANNLLASTGRDEAPASRPRPDGPGADRRPARDRGGRAGRARPLDPRADRRRHGAGRDRDPRADQRPAAPIEEALTRAGIAYQVRGVRFFDGARSAARSTSSGGPGFGARPGPALAGDDPGAVGRQARLRRRHRGRAGRRRGARADRGARHAARHPRDPGARRRAACDADGYLAELDRRRAAERAGSADGVNLLTYHRAKGLEWDAVFLPALEEGLLPIRQASMTTAARRGGAGCSTSGSPGRGCTSRCRGRPSARRAAGRPAASPAGSWPTSAPRRASRDPAPGPLRSGPGRSSRRPTSTCRCSSPTTADRRLNLRPDRPTTPELVARR